MELIRSLKGIFSIFSSYSQVMDGNMNVGKLKTSLKIIIDFFLLFSLPIFT
jgi:hypothetical protein